MPRFTGGLAGGLGQERGVGDGSETIRDRASSAWQFARFKRHAKATIRTAADSCCAYVAPRRAGCSVSLLRPAGGARWASAAQGAAAWRRRAPASSRRTSRHTRPASSSSALNAMSRVRSLDEAGKHVPETLQRVRQRLDAVFEDAIFHGRCMTNPVAAIRRKMRETLPTIGASEFAALPYADAPQFMAELSARPHGRARAHDSSRALPRDLFDLGERHRGGQARGHRSVPRAPGVGPDESGLQPRA